MIKPWIALTAIVISTSALHASEPMTPTDKTNVIAFVGGSSSRDVEYRHLFLNSRVALIVLAGYHEQTVDSADPFAFHDSRHGSEVGVGLRHNFSTADQIRPFVQLTVDRASSSGNVGNCDSSTFWGYSALGGAEYFVGRRVSLEGSAGLEVGRSRYGCFPSDGTAPSRGHATTVDTFRTALGINFYF